MKEIENNTKLKILKYQMLFTGIDFHLNTFAARK